MLNKLLNTLDQVKASDLYISVGLPPTIKLNGRLESLSEKNLAADDIYDLLASTMDEDRMAEFKSKKEANFAIHLPDAGRFRISAFMQKDSPGMVVRRIQGNIPTFEELYLPEQLKEACMAKRGLILFVGATGAGKSTTQAAMIGFRNQHASGHILTVEDPIEFVHEHARSVITQREVGLDTDSFEEALRNSLRQAPDVIVQGEIRTRETMQYALTFAETGHLCMATLHANNANQALDRILHLVPKERHRQFLFDLSVNLKAIVAQQLIPTVDGKGSRAAFEIMFNTPTLADAIRKGDLHLLKDIMKASTEHGMQTFDQALFNLYDEGHIGYTEALAHADSSNDLRLMIKLKETGASANRSAGTLNDVTVG
ncbi:PilT/PilU family type 4a pilus ATPase [Psychromonas sp. RZ22]|uniref:PilT/PilU family type 4a pilus ATPase n=1 Tax=Psychromonas algarum TaxID=2555643 RepID=UPI00106802FE|nr:PilT/PilU family type 4a pilus ATPase [Psychromonas sp. RZ22]TEW54566.1 PilT/PilU family type 4a pilus ATPase [Psychromonas sp. RZ22]